MVPHVLGSVRFDFLHSKLLNTSGLATPASCWFCRHQRQFSAGSLALSDKFLPQSTWVQQHFRFFALRFMLDGWTDRTVSSLVLALDSSRRPLRSKSPPRRGYYFYRYYFRRIVYNNTHHREAKLNQVYVLARWIMIWLRKRIFFSLSLFVEENLFVRVLVIKKIFIARSPDRFSGLTFQHLQDFFFLPPQLKIKKTAAKASYAVDKLRMPRWNIKPLHSNLHKTATPCQKKQEQKIERRHQPQNPAESNLVWSGQTL